MFEISFALSLTETGYPRRKARSRRSAFARFTRYSASDIAPAIATAVAPSREKIFWTTFDPTKNPFEARLSAARTTPSLLRMPTVVVMLNLGSPMWPVGYVDSNCNLSVTEHEARSDGESTIDSRADSAIRVRGNLSRHVVEQLVAESCRLVESAGRVHLRGHRELTWPDEDFDSDGVVLQGPAQPETFIRLRKPVPSQGSDPGPAERTNESSQVDVSR